MKKNMGTADKVIRILIAVVVGVGVLYFTNAISGTLAIGLGILAIVFVLTAIIRFCPLYLPFGISTSRKEK